MSGPSEVVVWATILLGGAATFATRMAFLAVAHRRTDVPVRVQRVLRMIPPAALAALVAPPLLRPGGGGVELLHARPIAGVVAGVVAWRTRSVLATMGVGVAVLVALERTPLG